jgi:O-antigen ligase
MGLFALWTVTTVLWSPLRVMSFGHALEVAMLTALGVCAAIVVDSGRKLERLCLGFFLVMAAACAFVMAMDSPAILAGARPIGYMHPNSLAALAGVALVILLASRILMGWTWSRRLLIPGVLVCATAIYVARSRTGIMATLVVASVLLILFGRRTSALLLLIACGGLFALMPYIGALENLDRKAAAYFLRGQTREDLMTASGRDEVWAIALNSAREAPLFGHGYYSMSDSGRVFVWGKEQVQTAHDVYLHVLTGTGAIGLALFLWGLASLIVPLIGSAIRSRNRMAILALSVMLWQLIGTLFEVGIVGPIDAVTVSFFAIGGAAVGNTLDESDFSEASRCAS